jgi:hypothetical protein
VIVALLVLIVLGGLPLLEVVDDVKRPASPSVSVGADGPDDAGGVDASRHAMVASALPDAPRHRDTGRPSLQIDGPAPGHAPRLSHESRGPPLPLPVA